MVDRYLKMFAGLEKRGEGAFIPFTVLGYPTPDKSFEIIQTLIDAGADALELGMPFSDPIADGIVIQKAALRARKAGTTIEDCFKIIRKIRDRNSKIPIGILVYANLVESNGEKAFFGKAAASGVDSVLVPDIPVSEISLYKKAAHKFGLKVVLILPLDSAPGKLKTIARETEGYLYLLSRRGVTGVDSKAGLPSQELIKRLKNLGSPPPVLGFGISEPVQVKAAIKAGCKGVISGSAVVKRVREDLACLGVFISEMKAKTRLS